MHSSIKILNSRGCCFFCLKIINKNELDNENDDTGVHAGSLRILLRHLQINPKSIPGHSFVFAKAMENIYVDLCHSCQMMTSRFSVLFLQLLKVQLEMDYFLQKIQDSISKSAKNVELVQKYSKRMTSDPEALTQLAFVDNLRKNIACKSLDMQVGPVLQIKLNRVKVVEKSVPITKKEIIEKVDPDEDFETNFEELDDDNFLAGKCLGPETPIKNMSIPTKKSQPLVRSKEVFLKNSATGLVHCKKCNKSSRYYSTIRRHFLADHLQKRFKCDICNIAVFRQTSHLTTHKKSCGKVKVSKKQNRPKINLINPKYKYPCKLCPKRFESKLKLYGHRSAVQKGIRFVCDICNKTFKQKCGLNNHKYAIHLGRKFYCKFCKKRSSYKYDLKRHESKCPNRIKTEPI